MKLVFSSSKLAVYYYLTIMKLKILPSAKNIHWTDGQWQNCQTSNKTTRTTELINQWINHFTSSTSKTFSLVTNEIK